ncbi:hypothetical protein HY414_01165 [Candidatus Kaiserbacteria bacterium]|nr:hypothetical protein [Candidatus Kaiserbacteria bacterium]
MPSWYTNEKAIWLGWLAGWLYIIALVLMFGSGFIAGIAQIDMSADYISAAEMIVFFGLFILFMLGIRGVAVRTAAPAFIRVVNTWIAINILEMLLLLPWSFPRYFETDFLTLLLVAVLPVLCVNGIVLIRFSEQFGTFVPQFGTRANRIAWWLKVSGWMLASIILFIPGLLVFIVAEFYMWRLLASETSRTA